MQQNRILLWDLPLRLFHWLLFLLVIGAASTAIVGGEMMVWHGLIGQLILGLLAFRLAWGLVGSTYARFGYFLAGPDTIAAYLRGQWQGIGHNPLGALSILALIAVLFLQIVLGLFSNVIDSSTVISESADPCRALTNFCGPLTVFISKDTSDFITGLHRANAWLVGGLVTLHVIAVLYLSLTRKDNLVRPMITGWKEVSDPAAQSATGGGLAAVLIAVLFAIIILWIANGGPVTAGPG